MYKLMVVDDEYNIRDGIVHAVPWDTCDVVVVSEAANGVEALAKAELDPPDLVISDINMDEMDGLELVERLKARYPDIKVIILSGYDEFDYAKKALQLKCSAYLLKPILPDELITVVRKVITEIQAEAQIRERMQSLESEIRINREVFQERLMNDLIHRTISDEAEFRERLALAGLHLNGPAYCCLLIAQDGYIEYKETKGIAEVQLLQRKMRSLIQDILMTEYDVWSFVDNNDQILVIIGGTAEGHQLRNLAAMLEKLRDTMRRLIGITTTIGTGSLCTQLTDLATSYADAMKALDFRVVVGTDCVIDIDDVKVITHGQFYYPQDKEAAVLKSLAEADVPKIRAAIADFFAELGAHKYRKEHLRIAVMELFALAARKFMDLGLDIHVIYERDLIDPYSVLDRFDTIDAVKNWLTNVVVGCSTELNNRRSNSVTNVVARVQEFIANNYTNPDISLNSIAEHVYLNPTYLSKLYKSKTGETYQEYLTRLRMDKARQLLRNTNIRTSEVGIAVGYPNAQYFTTLFRNRQDPT
jgi:two-component system response regulator YesN